MADVVSLTYLPFESAKVFQAEQREILYNVFSERYTRNILSRSVVKFHPTGMSTFTLRGTLYRHKENRDVLTDDQIQKIVDAGICPICNKGKFDSTQGDALHGSIEIEFACDNCGEVFVLTYIAVSGVTVG